MLDTKFWEKYFEVYDVLNESIPYQELIQDIVDTLDVKEGDRILDVGSGTGNLAVVLEKRGAKVIGIDFSQEGVARHRKKIPNAEVYGRDITEPFPFENESFDKILCNNVVYAIPKNKRQKLIKESFKILKKGGIILICNPTKNKKFRIFHIYKRHILESFKTYGFLKTMFEMFYFLFIIIKLIYYNLIIKNNSKSFEFGFLSIPEQESLILKENFNIKDKTKYVYAGQSILSVGYKSFF